MLNSPFIQVEGSIALPRIRPLGRMPLTFGREWMLTPPHFCLRAEIRALYAAIMRTVCLSAEAFREACRWDTQHHLFPVPTAAPVRPSAGVKASQSLAKDKAPPHVAAAQSPRPSPTPASGGHKLAGGACAIGGAALLAWIVASHTPHDQDYKNAAVDAGPISDAGNVASQRLADTRAAHETTTTTTTAPTTDTVTSASQSGQITDASQRAASATVGEVARDVARAVASPVVTAPAPSPSSTRPDYAAANHPTAPLRATLSDRANRAGEGRTNKKRESVRGRPSRERIAGVSRVESSRHPAHSFAPTRMAKPVTTHRTLGTYSEASDYSPRQPSARQDDDYASIITYATTHTAPRPASRASVPVDSTEWVNHVSQRRVTEIPDRFGK
ncbi:hypothetical protein [Paraburkholderia dinghuensis]|uniref:Uncharacterized protein n=1 Tax=Paraburkholderia dinghuensis TaxID=2305225 RepID=A0A3N6N0D0_9BURK|nr:hypothetical protein [Paraburkholderia dinghuensis]RQH09748.1 hypothetical protein D1Y85_00930 [Paraburkholderia dinghuensis]